MKKRVFSFLFLAMCGITVSESIFAGDDIIIHRPDLSNRNTYENDISNISRHDFAKFTPEEKTFLQAPKIKIWLKHVHKESPLDEEMRIPVPYD